MFCIQLLSACSATKHLIKDNQSLLVSNNIDIKFKGKVAGDKTTLKSDLSNQVVYDQHPNKKFLSLFRLKLGIYTKSVLRNEKRILRENKLDSIYSSNNYSNKEEREYKKVQKKRKFENILSESSSGEAPVFFDSTTISTSINRMKNYLFYHGYFYNEVTSSFKTKKKIHT